VSSNLTSRYAAVSYPNLDRVKRKLCDIPSNEFMNSGPNHITPTKFSGSTQNSSLNQQERLKKHIVEESNDSHIVWNLQSPHSPKLRSENRGP
jgi:hypothetical protein